MPNDNRTHALDTLKDRGRFPEIPRSLILHAELVQLASAPSRLLDELARDGDTTATAINAMFRKAIHATGLSADDILRRADFRPRDLDPTRLSSAFAEIRAANWLLDLGFRDINIIAKQPTRSSDITALFEGRKFAVEVLNSTFGAAGRVIGADLAGWMSGRITAEMKQDQTAGTAARTSCDCSLFVAVIDTPAAVALNERGELFQVARDVWTRIGGIGAQFVAIVTGRISLGNGNKDVIFPPLNPYDAISPSDDHAL